MDDFVGNSIKNVFIKQWDPCFKAKGDVVDCKLGFFHKSKEQSKLLIIHAPIILISLAFSHSGKLDFYHHFILLKFWLSA